MPTTTEDRHVPPEYDGSDLDLINKVIEYMEEHGTCSGPGTNGEVCVDVAIAIALGYGKHKARNYYNFILTPIRSELQYWPPDITVIAPKFAERLGRILGLEQRHSALYDTPQPWAQVLYTWNDHVHDYKKAKAAVEDGYTDMHHGRIYRVADSALWSTFEQTVEYVEGRYPEDRRDVLESMKYARGVIKREDGDK